MTANTADIRQYLSSAYNDEELTTLSFEYFRDVHDNFTVGMTKAAKIQLLFDHCQRREMIPNLLAALERDRPEQYRKRFGQAVAAPGPAQPPTVRDPRQVFISYAHEDADFAHRLAADLAQHGWRPWIAPDSIRPGEKWAEAIERGLEKCSIFLVVLTPAAVESRWVKTETNAAIELEHIGDVSFIPLDVESCGVPALWSTYQRVSFRIRYEDGLWALLNRLRRRLPIDFDWVTIPAGEFLMGSDKAKDQLAYSSEIPQHTPYLPEYRIARLPVTVEQFDAFMAACPDYRTTAEVRGSAWSLSGSRWEITTGADWTHPRGPKSDVGSKLNHPVTCVSCTMHWLFASGPACDCPSKQSGRKLRAGSRGSSGRGEIVSRTTDCVTLA